MTDFRPANSDHAVTNVVFLLEYDRLLPAAAIAELAASASARTKLSFHEALPAVVGVPPMTIQDPLSNTAQHSGPGIQFSYLRPNGQPSWLVRMVGDEIRVECAQYTRWAKIWGAAESYIRAADGYLRGFDDSLRANRLTLHVIDKFVGAKSGYDVGEIIRDKGLLGSTPFERGDLWHTYLGWFDRPAWGRVLNNLNVQASGEGKSAEPLPIDMEPFSVTITHVQQAVPQNAFAVDLPDLSPTMTLMHDNNKHLLHELLTDEALGKIGLMAQ